VSNTESTQEAMDILIDQYGDARGMMVASINEQIMQVLASRDHARCLGMIGSLHAYSLQYLPEVPGWLSLLTAAKKSFDQEAEE